MRQLDVLTGRGAALQFRAGVQACASGFDYLASMDEPALARFHLCGCLTPTTKLCQARPPRFRPHCQEGC